MKANFLFAVCLASVLASGCTAASHDTQTSSSSSPPLPHLQTFIFPLAESVAVGNRSADKYVQEGGQPPSNPQNGGRLKIEANATDVLVEAKFSCSSSTCRYFPQLRFAQDIAFTKYGPTVDGTVRWKYAATGPLPAGDWGFTIFPDSANVGMKGEARVTVFYGQPIADGFTAF